jgi:hypothetical protein
MASVTDKVAEVAEQAKDKLKESNIGQGVKESLIGSEVDTIIPSQYKAEFAKHAIKDEETGEEYLGPKEFVDAIAPVDEDYVSTNFSFLICRHGGWAGRRWCGYEGWRKYL